MFYLDSGHSFDNVLFYGNDTMLFLYELLVFIWIFVLSDSYVAGILGVAGVQQVWMNLGFVLLIVVEEINFLLRSFNM